MAANEQGARRSSRRRNRIGKRSLLRQPRMVCGHVEDSGTTYVAASYPDVSGLEERDMVWLYERGRIGEDSRPLK